MGDQDLLTLSPPTPSFPARRRLDNTYPWRLRNTQYKQRRRTTTRYMHYSCVEMYSAICIICVYIYLHGDADRRICTLARLSDSVGASWKFLRASCEPARILQGTACHLLGPARSLLQPRGSSLKNPKTPSGHSYQPLALSWKLPGTQELQTHAPEILFFAKKNKDFVFYMKLTLITMM